MVPLYHGGSNDTQLSPSCTLNILDLYFTHNLNWKIHIFYEARRSAASPPKRCPENSLSNWRVLQVTHEVFSHLVAALWSPDLNAVRSDVSCRLSCPLHPDVFSMFGCS
ncbi:hypothetical protein E2C01_053814 [Portunus trituberculatus]|uniref:Uncharacterized protein n=1 Tax=Portunus trituberculatus TaxID=210409 RepID=A0A5B7GQD4_PORTR|nr:hypothetical protein [Portunus trituberculatus]